VKKNHAKLGRPTKRTKELDTAIIHLAGLGYTNVEIAEAVGIAEWTLQAWIRDDESLSQAVKSAKRLVDSEVEQALLKRAKGLAIKKTQFATFQGQITDREEYEEIIPPDTRAIEFWLKNRQPERWTEKKTIAHEGVKGIDINFIGEDTDKDASSE
jgi:hypothetical protein